MVDNNLGNFGAHGWKNIYPLGRQPALAYFNADSWAYFGLAAQQLTQGRTISTSGKISSIRPNVYIDLSGSLPNTVLVTAPAQSLRIRTPSSTIPGDILKAQRGTLERKAIATAVISSHRVLTKISLYDSSLGISAPLATGDSTKRSTNAYPTAPLGTGSRKSSLFYPIWENLTKSTVGTGFSTSYKPSSTWLSNPTTFVGSNTASGSFRLPLLSTFSTSATRAHSTSTSDTGPSSNSIKISSTPVLVQASSSFLSATTSLDSPGNFTGSNSASVSSSTDNRRTSKGGYLSSQLYTHKYTRPGGFITVVKQVHWLSRYLMCHYRYAQLQVISTELGGPSPPALHPQLPLLYVQFVRKTVHPLDL